MGDHRIVHRLQRDRECRRLGEGHVGAWDGLDPAEVSHDELGEGRLRPNP